MCRMLSIGGVLAQSCRAKSPSVLSDFLSLTYVHLSNPSVQRRLTISAFFLSSPLYGLQLLLSFDSLACPLSPSLPLPPMSSSSSHIHLPMVPSHPPQINTQQEPLLDTPTPSTPAPPLIHKSTITKSNHRAQTIAHIPLQGQASYQKLLR